MFGKKKQPSDIDALKMRLEDCIAGIQAIAEGKKPNVPPPEISDMAEKIRYAVAAWAAGHFKPFTFAFEHHRFYVSYNEETDELRISRKAMK